MTHLDAKTWQAARRGLQRAVALHLHDPNVTLIDLGYLAEADPSTARVEELRIRLQVRRKLCGKKFEIFRSRYPERVISAARIGFPVTVMEIDYECHRASSGFSSQTTSPATLCAGSHTLGSRVRDCRSGEELMLNCEHVFAALRTPEGGVVIDTIAERPHAKKRASKPQLLRHARRAHLDAAVARVPDNTRMLEHTGTPGAAIPLLGMRLIKKGPGASVQAGKITGILGHAMVRIKGKRHSVSHLFQISPLHEDLPAGEAGDSGAWWLEEETERAVGLHWGGSKPPAVALAFSMPEVLRALNVEIPAIAPVHSLPARAHEQAGEIVLAKDRGAAEREFSFSWTSLARRLFYGVALSTVVFVAASARVQNLEQLLSQKSEECRSALQQLSAVARMDSVRRRDLEKILEIIAYHNPEMRSDLRNEIAVLIHEMSCKYRNLSPELICATITHESARTWEPTVVSSAGAVGLMQIMPSTGRQLAGMEGMAWTSTEDMLEHPLINIRLGCRYLSMLVAAYSLDGGLAAYNGGEWRVEKWLRSGRAPGILREETAKYVPAILRLYEEYRRPRLAELEGFRTLAQISKRPRMAATVDK